MLRNNISNWLPENPSVDITKCDNLAKAKFYKAVSSRQTKMQGLVFLGELKETLRMLRRPAAGLQDGIKDYLKAVKRHKKASGRNWIRNAGEAWLEHAFGWSPFINDIKDATSAFKALVDKRKDEVQHINVGVTLRYDRTSSLTSYQKPGFLYVYNNGPYIINARALLYEVHKVRYRGAVRTQVEAPTWNERLNDGLSLFGITPRQFIPTAWELLPWSFLADYFSNIGDLLDCSVVDMSNLVYVNRSAIRETRKYGTWVISADLTAAKGAPWDKVIKGGDSQCNCLLKRKLVVRSAGSTISMPTLQFESNLSDGQLGNIAALLSLATGIHPQNTQRNWHR